VILSGNSVLISGGASSSVGGAGSGVSLLVATGSINSGGFTGNVLLSGAGNVTTFTGNPLQRLIVVSGNTGAYANFLTAGNVGGVRTIQTTGAYPSGIISGSVLISGVTNNIAVTTGAAGQIVISGDTGVFALSNNLQATGGNLQSQLLSLSGSITGGSLVVQTGLLTGVKNDISFYTPFVTTGLFLQETFVSNVMFITGYSIGAVTSGVGGAHMTSGASGAILQYPMVGELYHRTTGNSTGLISSFTFESGITYKKFTVANFATSREGRVGLSIFSGLSGLSNVTFGIFGIFSGV
jgi:hypothetical protein